MEYIISVILSIIGNLLTPTAKRLLQWPIEPNDPRPLRLPEVQDPLSEEGKEIIRARNRQKFERLTMILWLHLITFGFLFGAFYVPLSIKGMAKDIPLSATRLPSVAANYSLDHEKLALLSLILTLIMYLPLWLLSQPIGRLLATLWDQLQKVNPARYAALIALAFIALSFFVTGNWIYILFPQNSYLTSMTIPVMAVFGVGYVSSNMRR